MENYIGKICPYCKVALAESEDVVVCSQCEMPHHRDCWIENQGCTTFGCNGSIQGVPRAEFDIASNVATPKFNQASSAGTTSAATYYMQPADSQAADIGLHTLYCNHCGTLVGENTKKCPKCGKEISKASKSKKWVVIACVFIVVTIATTIFAGVQYSLYNDALYTIDDLNDELDNVKKEKTTLSSKVDSLNKEVRNLESDLQFYQNHVVFVGSEYYSSYYHTDPNCAYFQGRFWAFNSEAAIGKGYWKCPHCG